MGTNRIRKDGVVVVTAATFGTTTAMATNGATDSMEIVTKMATAKAETPTLIAPYRAHLRG